MALHRAEQATVGLFSRFGDEPTGEEASEDEREDDDHERPADELGQRELPAEQDSHHDPELDHEVGGGELEHHRRGEVGAAAKDGARHRHGRVGAGGARGAKPASDPERTRGVVREETAHLLLGDDSLHRRRNCEAEDQRPEDFPEHPEGEAERIAEFGHDVDVSKTDAHAVSLSSIGARPVFWRRPSSLRWSLFRASPPRLAVVSEVATLASVKIE